MSPTSLSARESHPTDDVPQDPAAQNQAWVSEVALGHGPRDLHPVAKGNLVKPRGI